MAKVPVGQVKPGVTVLSAVTDRHGRLLVPEGTELTERHVQALKMWGVSWVELDGVDAADELESVPDDLVEEARQELEAAFALTDRQHPLIEALFEIALTRRAKALVDRIREVGHA